MRCQAVFKLQIIAIVLLQFAKGYPQQAPVAADTEEQNEIRGARPGRYVPELHGGHRGRYVPDLSGKYQHMVRPYDGGYGDRGLKYQQDLRGILQGLPRRSNAGSEAFGLGPRDHLRFMIDFNYDGSGWQVLQFEWKRDGEESQSYNYQKENKLDWGLESDAAEGQASAEATVEDNVSVEGYVIETPAAAGAASSAVHVDGEYDANIYNVSYKDDNTQVGADPKDLQSTIKEVLDYVQTHILPTLT